MGWKERDPTLTLVSAVLTEMDERRQARWEAIADGLEDSTGPGARVKLKAEADFDPSSPEHHTITQELYVDPDTQEVVVTPPVVRNEFE